MALLARQRQPRFGIVRIDPDCAADLGRGAVAPDADMAEAVDLGPVGRRLRQDVPRCDRGTACRQRQRRQEYEANGEGESTRQTPARGAAGNMHLELLMLMLRVVWITSFRQGQSDTQNYRFPRRLRAPQLSTPVTTSMWTEIAPALWWKYNKMCLRTGPATAAARLSHLDHGACAAQIPRYRCCSSGSAINCADVPLHTVRPRSMMV